MLKKVKKYANKLKFKLLISLSFFTLIPTVVFAQNRGLNIVDLGVIKAKVEFAKLLVGQLKPYFDSHIGRINTEFINTSFLREQFLVVSLSFLGLLILFEIIMIIIGQSKFHTFLPRFVTSLIASTAYLAIITMVVNLADALMSGLMGGTPSFVEFTQKSIDALMVSQDLSTTIWNTFTIINLNPFDLNSVIGGQTKLVIDILLGLYMIIPMFVGIGQFITDVVISIMIIISPIVAITHIHGIKSPISKNYWTVFFELIVGKIAFTLAYTFIVNHVTDKIKGATGALDIGLALYILACFLSIGAVTMAVKEVFNFGTSGLKHEIKDGASKPVTFVQNTINTTASTMNTIQSLRRGR